MASARNSAAYESPSPSPSSPASHSTRLKSKPPNVLETSETSETNGGLDVDFKDGPPLTLADPRAAQNGGHKTPSSTSGQLVQQGDSQSPSQSPRARKPLPAPPAGASGGSIDGGSDGSEKIGRDGSQGAASTRPAVEPTPFGMPYSSRNPAPNIHTFREHQLVKQEESKKYFESQKALPQLPKEQEGEGANTAKLGAVAAEANVDSGTESKEKSDPTGHEAPTPSDGGPKAGATADVPIGAEKSNVLFYPTPKVNFEPVFIALKQDLQQVSYLVFASILLLDWLFIGGGWKGFMKSLLPAGGVAAAVYFILEMAGRKTSETKMQQTNPPKEKLKYVPESVEWMNSLVDTLWRTLQQEFFDNIRNQINDTIKPYIPQGVPATVKITNLSHGIHPVRVLSMRSLPDSHFGDLVPTHGLDKDGSTDDRKEREKKVAQEEGGVFYNLEIAIAYHETPFRSRKEHMHVDVLAMVGPVPLPVFVQVREFVATIRIRLQMHPDLPFLKNVTFALTENPKINACVSFGAPWAFDLLNLPVIDSVLESQINNAATQFVQPKSMSLDMTAYIGGSDQKLDTDAIGVLFVKIHRARNLARQDTKGPGADPYLTIAFSKYEKPMYATRIIKGDRNPVWEETAFVMIRAEHVKRNEKVLLRLWDSDTTGSDDISGVCEIPLHELILKANQMQKREDQLQGDVAGTDADGVLDWEIGYFPRAEYQKALRTDAMDPKDRHGGKTEVAETEKSQNAQNTVPDPNLPSGILGVTIHQAINVQIKNSNQKSMGHVKVRGQDSDGEDDDKEEEITIDYIPSLYVTADLNDRLFYRTRVKSITNMPTFNSSTETYVRDWRMATLTLSVWDTRRKENDRLVGAVTLKLSDVFHESSSVVKFYDLKGGDGSGRIRVALIFRSMKMKLEESLLGYDVGSFVFTSPITCTGNMNTGVLKLRASGSQRLVKTGGSKTDTGRHTWTLQKPQDTLPVHYRYLSPVVLEFVGSGLTEKLSSTPVGKSKHYAVLWLSTLIDNKSTSFVLPIWKTNNPLRLTQNVVFTPDDTMTLEKVGEVRFEGMFKAGIDETHADFLGKNHNAWSTYQSWLAARKSGQRANQVNRTTNETVDRLAKGITKSLSIEV